MRLKYNTFRLILFAVTVVALLVGYHLLILYHAPSVFRDELEDLSFGWYIPLFSLYVLWYDRKTIVESIGEPSWWGVIFALPFIFCGFLGARGIQVRMEIVGFVGLLISMALAFFGRTTMKRVLFPALFLLFCLPLHTFLDIVTIHLRLLAVSIAHGTIHGVGVEIVRQGTMLSSPSGLFAIDVADPCSGMRSLFAMMALTAGYSYFVQPTWIRRGLLFALAIPIAVLGNVFRIISIIAVSALCSQEFALGFYHDYSGYVVFLVSISLMVGCSALITKGFERCARKC